MTWHRVAPFPTRPHLEAAKARHHHPAALDEAQTDRLEQLVN